MQVLRTTTATPVVEPNYGVTRSTASAAPVAPPAPTVEVRQAATAPTEEHTVEVAKQRRTTTQPADLPSLSGSDRAAIASATGFYISPTGEVTPDGMPPWSFIMQYLQRRHTAPPAAETAEQPAPATAASAEDGRRFDLQV